MAAEHDIDQVIYSAFFAKNSNPGVIIDVGAAGPDYLSISAMYRDLGWKVIPIEPNPVFCEMYHRKGYPVYQVACSDKDEDEVDFYVVDSKGAEYEGGNVTFESYSSLEIKDQFSEHYRMSQDARPSQRIKVSARRLDTLLAQYEPNLTSIDILAIDVEGWELTVLEGFDLAKRKPLIIILENMFDNQQYREYMRAHGYFFWNKLGLNEIYALPRMFSLKARALEGMRTLKRTLLNRNLW